MTDARLQRVCVSSWSFHTAFERDRDNPAKVLMDILDFPGMIADRYQIHNIEVVLPHFADPSPQRVAAFKARLAAAGSRVVNMPLDFAALWNTPAISSTDPAERDAALAMYRSGIDTAHAIGSPTVRCDPGVVNLDDPSLTIDAYRQLAAYAGARGITVVVENHGPIAKDPDALAGILTAAGVGSLPDFGNFPDEDTRERGLRVLFPLAGDVAHAKLREGWDFGRCLRIAKESGFTGMFSIEAGGKEDPYVEVQRIADALVAGL